MSSPVIMEAAKRSRWIKDSLRGLVFRNRLGLFGLLQKLSPRLPKTIVFLPWDRKPWDGGKRSSSGIVSTLVKGL